MTVSHTDSLDEKNTITTDTDQNTVQKILLEFGLNPSDYIFNSTIEEEEILSDHSSAFKRYFSSKPISIISSRSLTYVQQPFPPKPVINRQASNSKSPIDMTTQQRTSSRRTPPPPPPTTSTALRSAVSNESLSAEDYLRHINSQDTPPVKVVKPNAENLVYKKEIRIRYLQPPTPPPPAPIIIREKQIPPNPPESPLLIRERKPEPRTPPPLTIRERPPTPPPILEPYVVEKPIPPPPPQPRQIIIERLPTPPPKPRTVVFEKWLPYKKVKRPILLQKAPPLPPVQPTRNVIIEYEPLKAYTVRRVIEEGVFRVDPNQYSTYNVQQSDPNIRIVDRIDDLPPPSEDLMRILQGYQTATTPNNDRLNEITRLAQTTTNRQQQQTIPTPITRSLNATPSV